VTKAILKIERHYGNKDFKTIIENIIKMKLTNLKFNNESNDESDYNNICTDKVALIREESNSE
jgi:hypothetical protein